MADLSEVNAAGVDFAVVAFREEGVWQVEPIAQQRIEDIDALSRELRRWPGDGGSIGLVSFDEDFFLLVRVLGPITRLLLSDVSAAGDWPVARSALEYLDLPVVDEEEQAPAGDLGIVSDLGLDAMDMGALLDDDDLYPDEMLGDIASRIGFGAQFDQAVEVAAP